jgi:formylglycine-generating enzyme
MQACMLVVRGYTMSEVIAMNRCKSLGILCFMILSAACATNFDKNKIGEEYHGPSQVLAKNRVSTEQQKHACPSDMVEIEGDFCPNPEEICLYDVDAAGNKLPGPHKEFGRCGEFKYPTRCLSNKIHKHYCIDIYEFPNKKGEVPQDWMTYTDLENAGKPLGKRVCTSSEWALAAEGPNMDPLPYGDGYHRAVRQSVCNMDHSIKGINVFKATSPHSTTGQLLHNLLVPSGSMPDCHSKFGVYDMTANLDEWVKNETGIGYPTGLMSGHIFGVRNTARAITVAHNGRVFSWYETGGRLCQDIK